MLLTWNLSYLSTESNEENLHVIWLNRWNKGFERAAIELCDNQIEQFLLLFHFFIPTKAQPCRQSAPLDLRPVSCCHNIENYRLVCGKTYVGK